MLEQAHKYFFNAVVIGKSGLTEDNLISPDEYDDVAYPPPFVALFSSVNAPRIYGLAGRKDDPQRRE
jgi:hypothetical protein